MANDHASYITRRGVIYFAQVYSHNIHILFCSTNMLFELVDCLFLLVKSLNDMDLLLIFILKIPGSRSESNPPCDAGEFFGNHWICI